MHGRGLALPERRRGSCEMRLNRREVVPAGRAVVHINAGIGGGRKAPVQPRDVASIRRRASARRGGRLPRSRVRTHAQSGRAE
eukprot:6184275-Pleurochrysis_carterae.AAC.2